MNEQPSFALIRLDVPPIPRRLHARYRAIISLEWRSPRTWKVLLRSIRRSVWMILPNVREGGCEEWEVWRFDQKDIR